MSDLELDEDFESLDEAYDEAEFDESDEFAEAARPFPFPFSFLPNQARANLRAPSTATGRNLFQPRPTANYVTQAQLQAAMNRVGAQVKTNSQAIARVSSAVRSVGAAQSKQTAALKKEIGVRRKQTESLKKDLKQTRDLAALMPMISRPSSITLTTASGTLPAGTKVLVDKGDSFSTMLPLLMMGGMGGGEGGSDNNMMMFMLLAMSSK